MILLVSDEFFAEISEQLLVKRGNFELPSANLVKWQVSSNPPKNIELLVHHDGTLIILKFVIENVILMDYQSKNVFCKNKHHNALAHEDGRGQSQPF